MYAGFMREKNKPGYIAKLLAIMCQHIGIDLIYFTPKGVLQAENKVKGKRLEGETWVDAEVELPKFIDVNPNFFNKGEYKGIMSYLKEHTTLSTDRRNPLPKKDLHKHFENDPIISKVLIPTKLITDIKDIKQFMDEHGSVVLKAVSSLQGKDVYILNKRGSDYVLGHGKSESVLTDKEFKNKFAEIAGSKDFIVQKYIESRDRHGNPIDCRVHVEKNGKGKWSNVRNFVRIGVGQKVVSNVHQGGGISDLNKFLNANFDDYEHIVKKIKEIAQTLPYKVEKKLGKKYMVFGFDIGIDKTGKLYLFEINSYPIVSPMKSKVALTRSKYYKYMIEK